MHQKLIIIDSHHLCHRVKYSLKGLLHEEIATGVLYGFLNSLVKIADRFPMPNHVYIFTWDSHQSIRKVIYDGYKKRRDDYWMDEEDVELAKIVSLQIPLLRKSILPSIGFKNIFMQTGYEADDLIAFLVQKCHINHEIIVVSKDSDLFQLLNHCSMFYPDELRLYTIDDLNEQFGVTPDEWIRVKCIAGCRSDSVPGIKGVGIKTAIRYLKGMLGQKTLARANIESIDGQKRIKDNLSLVKLPLAGIKDLPIHLSENLKLVDFIAMCDEYGFRSFMTDKQLERWKTNFSLR
jgi:DNA polymerase-1